MFQIGDKIVYPMHGAGIIDSIEEKEILGSKKLYYSMNIDNMRVMFPMNTDLGIRQIVDTEIIEDVLTYFNDGDSDQFVNPSQRQRANLNKLKSGDIYQGAQVIRDLIRMNQKRNLATGDKNMLDNARQIFISELMLVKDINKDHAVEILNEVINNQN